MTDDEDFPDTTAVASHDPPHISQPRLFLMSIFWFAHMAQWTSVIFVILPLQTVLVLGEEQKATHLSLLVMGGGIASLISAPLFGALSDRTTTRKYGSPVCICCCLLFFRGRRVPFVILGGAGVVCALIGLAFSDTPQLSGLYITLFVLLQIFHSLATTPYSAVIPDVVPRQQFGAASAYLTVMTLLGILGGVILTGVSIEFTRVLWIGYVALAVLEAIGLIFVWGAINEPPVVRQFPPFSLRAYISESLRPFRDRSFNVVFWTRLFMLSAQYILLQFFVFYLRDVITAPYTFLGLDLVTPGQAYALFLAVALGGSVIAGLLSGILSDRIPRKVLVRAVFRAVVLRFPLLTCTLLPLPLVLFGLYSYLCLISLISLVTRASDLCRRRVASWRNHCHGVCAGVHRRGVSGICVRSGHRFVCKCCDCACCGYAAERGVCQRFGMCGVVVVCGGVLVDN